MLVDLLKQKKKDVINNWFEKVASTYPEDTAKFLKKEKDPFSNPVGQTTIAGLNAIYDYLTDKSDIENLTNFVDPVIRIRAIQNFTPKRAIEFIFYIKDSIIEIFKSDIEKHNLYHEILIFWNKIDLIALHFFEIYSECREKIYDIKANEYRKQTDRIKEKFNLLDENKENIQIKDEK